jgi:hypothetical protein
MSIRVFTQGHLEIKFLKIIDRTDFDEGGEEILFSDNRSLCYEIRVGFTEGNSHPDYLYSNKHAFISYNNDFSSADMDLKFELNSLNYEALGLGTNHSEADPFNKSDATIQDGKNRDTGDLVLSKGMMSIYEVDLIHKVPQAAKINLFSSGKRGSESFLSHTLEVEMTFYIAGIEEETLKID